MAYSVEAGSKGAWLVKVVLRGRRGCVGAIVLGVMGGGASKQRKGGLGAAA